jgi:GntR family transcriptional regulator
MAAVFIVDPRSGVPLYLQLTQQVKRAVALGTLAPGEQLPTVKALALELIINANTVARAYRELEREQIIETSPGRGSFVRGGNAPHESRRAVTDVASAAFDEAVRAARTYGISRTDIRTLFEHALERWFPAEGEENS